MAGSLVRVGAREFREDLAQYLDSPVPIAVTRHGQTVGYYIPTQQFHAERERVALQEAVGRLEALLVEQGIAEDEVVREFRARRTQQ